MFEKTVSVLIDRPPEVVFAYATDPQTTREWNPAVLSVRVEPSGPLAEGSKIVQQVRAPLRTIEGTYHVVSYEEGRQAVYRVETSFIAEETTYRVEPANGGTRLVVRVKGGLKGPWRLLEPLLTRSAPRQRRRMLEVIKRRLEKSERKPAS